MSIVITEQEGSATASELCQLLSIKRLMMAVPLGEAFALRTAKLLMTTPQVLRSKQQTATDMTQGMMDGQMSSWQRRLNKISV
jgi:hypothetical protein